MIQDLATAGARARSIETALNPMSIAVIGASENPNKIGGRPLLYLSRFGYAGRVYPINPKRRDVQGFRAYPEIAALPEPPDLAVIALPAAQAVGAVEACAAYGVKVAVVMSSGFAEVTDAAGAAAERAMLRSARAAGMRLVGPNCQGLANFGTGAVVSFSTMFLEIAPQDGPVAIISQSGVMSVVPYGLLRERSIGVRHAHATGNEADVTLSELAIAVLHDPDVKLLLLYMEAIRDPASLARAAELARERDVPIVAIKAGRTSRGQDAARSHTAALATEDRVVDAVLRDHGIWRARDIHELTNATDLYLKGWRPKGNRLVTVSNSGASGVMAADTAAELKLELSTLSDETISALRAKLPSFASVTNPIDVTGGLLSDSGLIGETLDTLAERQEADLYFLAIPVAGIGYDVERFARDTAAFAERVASPVVVAAPQDNVASAFRQAGVPTFSDQTEALEALAQLVAHVQLMRRRRPRPFSRLSVRLPEGPAQFLNEAESLTLLASFGLPVVPHRLCRTEADARAAFRQFGGGPVVLKGCSTDVPHKSEHGLVSLDVDSESDAAIAFNTLWERLRHVTAACDGVIVAPMARGRRELALGARVDPTFGPIVLVGDGGKYAEALGDFVLLSPPFGCSDVRHALSTLRIAPLLRGVRDDPPLDLDPFCEAAVRLGEILMSGAAEIASIDLNPVIVGAVATGVVIVDALIERSRG